MRLKCKVTDVGKEEHFRVITNQGLFESASLVVATGGLSFPDLGASGLGHRIARLFGLHVTPLSPGLVPFEFNRNDQKIFGALSGFPLMKVRCAARFQGRCLHPSGPQRARHAPGFFFWKGDS
jgi:predicted flavoprotein YhiN